MDPKNILQKEQMLTEAGQELSNTPKTGLLHSVGRQSLLVSRYQFTSVPKWLLGVV